MKLVPKLTEADYEDLSDILKSPGWKVLGKVKQVMLFNAGQAALNAIKRDTKVEGTTTHHSTEEQLSFIRGEVEGVNMLLNEIDKSEERRDAIRKKKAMLKKRMEEKAKKEK
jgi:hypothetical protein